MEKLFRDFEVQIKAERQKEIELDARELQRAEYARIQHLDRLAAQLGQELTVAVEGAQVYTGELQALGSGWIQMRSQTENVLIPQHALVWWEGGSRFSSVDAGSVKRQLTLGYALRALCSARLPVRIFHTSDSLTTEGTIERVGLDFIEVAVHGIEGNFRSKHILGYRMLSVSQIGAVCSAL